jgi:hypothetical protein
VTVQANSGINSSVGAGWTSPTVNTENVSLAAFGTVIIGGAGTLAIQFAASGFPSDFTLSYVNYFALQIA